MSNVAQFPNNNGGSNGGSAYQVAEKAAGSIYLTAVARLSMAIALPIIGLIAWQFDNAIDRRFRFIEDTILSQASTIEGLRAQQATQAQQIVEIKVNQERGRQDREEFQDLILGEFRDQRAVIVGLSNEIAALKATLDIIKNREQQQQNPEQ